MIIFISIGLFNTLVFSQTAVDINDENYKFKFTLPSGWSERKIEETTKKDAVSYSFDNKDGKIAIMLLAFKVNEVKNLTDFIYTLEKDLTLNIPKREGEYEDSDAGNHDRRLARYKDSEFTEIIYYYRTKINEGQNYTYLLRFITPSSFFNSTVDSDIKKLASNFSPVTE
ncbi:MAG: hypothetical protein ABIY50_09010 [Ignavibacteria bacterium]